MSEPKQLHRLSNGEWYTRAIKERGGTRILDTDLGFVDGEDLRVVFVLKGQVGNISWIVDRFVSEVWPEYQITEHCLTRHGSIVTVEEDPGNATQPGS